MKRLNFLRGGKYNLLKLIFWDAVEFVNHDKEHVPSTTNILWKSLEKCY